jgi:hypothetical protein
LKKCHKTFPAYILQLLGYKSKFTHCLIEILSEIILDASS